MRYFLDTEFVERGAEFPIELISVGIVAEDMREYYAQLLTHRGGYGKAMYGHPNDFVGRHVYPSLKHFDMGFQGRACDMRGQSCTLAETEGERCPWNTRSDVAWEINEFCNPEKFGKPEFWAWYGDYDWVVFCQIFGAMINLPKGWPMFCKDIKQMCDEMGNPDLSLLGKNDEHNALGDARFNLKRYNTLQAISARRS